MREKKKLVDNYAGNKHSSSKSSLLGKMVWKHDIGGVYLVKSAYRYWRYLIFFFYYECSTNCIECLRSLQLYDE